MPTLMNSETSSSSCQRKLLQETLSQWDNKDSSQDQLVVEVDSEEIEAEVASVEETEVEAASVVEIEVASVVETEVASEEEIEVASEVVASEEEEEADQVTFPLRRTSTDFN